MAVIDPDSRQLVPGPSPPWNAVARIKCASLGPPCYGTGFFITPTRLVTAGHVLHHTGLLGGMAASVVVELFGTTMAASSWKVHPMWEADQSYVHDVGYIDLHVQPGVVFSLLGLDSLQPSDLHAPSMIVGHPFNSSETSPKWAKGHVVKYHQGLAYHDVDTSKGQSGGPLIRNKMNIAFGIHTRDPDANSLSKELGVNVSVPLSPDLIKFLTG